MDDDYALAVDVTNAAIEDAINSVELTNAAIEDAISSRRGPPPCRASPRPPGSRSGGGCDDVSGTRRNWRRSPAGLNGSGRVAV